MTARAYYNEHDKNAAAWLRNLIASGHIAAGDVDERSIVDVQAADLEGYCQVHLFAGIGIWSLACRLAGIPDDEPIWTGSCPCFPAGTLIFTQRGQIPIENVRVGDMALTHKGRYRRVLLTGSDPDRACVTVRGQGHWGLACTPNHPFLCDEGAWVPAFDLKGKRWCNATATPRAAIPGVIADTKGYFFDNFVGKWRVKGEKNGLGVYVGLANTRHQARQMRLQAIKTGVIDVRGADAFNPATLGAARMLGYWLGDGWTSRNSIFLCGAKEDTALLNTLFIDARLPGAAYVERTSSRIRCGSQAVVRWLLAHFGQGAATKKIPTWVHGQSASWRKAFLDGYLLADGCQQLNGVAATTVSRAIAIGIRMLMNQQGMSASIRLNKVMSTKIIEGRQVNQKSWYRITGYTKKRSFNFARRQGWGLVRNVEAAETTTVYNLSVAEDESYVADGIAVHNCQPFSGAGLQLGTADKRHLWPEFRRLIGECAPSVVVGEQVASKLGRQWLAGVRADLERLGYGVGAADLCAASAGAPHIRQRLWWIADRVADNPGLARDGDLQPGGQHRQQPQDGRPGRLADGDGGRLPQLAQRDGGPLGGLEAPRRDDPGGRSLPDRLGDTQHARLEGHDRDGDHGGQPGWFAPVTHGPVASAGRPDAWSRYDIVHCTDGKARRFEPVTLEMADGPAGGMGRLRTLEDVFPLSTVAKDRVGRLRAYGNAIVAPLAAEFLKAAFDTLQELDET